MKTLRFLENTSSALYIISNGIILIAFIGVMTGFANVVLLCSCAGSIYEHRGICHRLLHL